MGHLVGKDLYRKLGKKIDSLPMRAPWNDALYAMVRELYSEEEADLIVKMPYGPATFDQIKQTTRMDEQRLRTLLDRLCLKGLVMDVSMNDICFYVISPIIVGIFEFTMMRTGEALDHKKWARLFNDYLLGDDSFLKANLGAGQRVSPLRALPHEGTIAETEHVEILDYERATAIVGAAAACAVGICSCRHEKLHIGEKKCDVPLETCLSFDSAADYLVRHGMARAAKKQEVLDSLARSREMGLVFCADNAKRNVSFICQCCGCCCNALLGISRMGYANMVVTSNFIAKSDHDQCLSCGSCVEACPIQAISMNADGHPAVDESVCLGCGVCALACETEAMRLVEREQRVLHPEDTFERVVLQSLERGTLQNLVFGNPRKISHALMRGVAGAFLKIPPVKRRLMSETLRSKFLSAMRRGS
jgi:Pyruvate/2-oxoacid:ferredoxin oxidoreductase delta subunit